MYNNIGVPDAEKGILERIAEAQNAVGDPLAGSKNDPVLEKSSIVVTDATPTRVQDGFGASERRERPKTWSISSSPSTKDRSKSPMLGIKHNGILIGYQRSGISPVSRSRSHSLLGISPSTSHQSMPKSPQSAGLSIDPARKSVSQTVYERELLTSLGEKNILLESCRETCSDLTIRLEKSEESHKALLGEIDEQKEASGYNDHSFESLLESYKEYKLAEDLEATKEALSKADTVVSAQESRVGELEALLKEYNAELGRYRDSRKRSISAAVSRHHSRSSSITSSRLHRKMSSIDSFDHSPVSHLWNLNTNLPSSTSATSAISPGRSPASPDLIGLSAGVRLLKDLLARTLLMRCQLALAADKTPLAEKLAGKAAAAARGSSDILLHEQITTWQREAQEQMQGYQSPSTNYESRSSQASMSAELPDFDDSPKSSFGNIDLVLQPDTPSAPQNYTFERMHGSKTSFGSSRSLRKYRPPPLSGVGLGIDLGPAPASQLAPIKESPTGSPTPRASEFTRDQIGNNASDSAVIGGESLIPDPLAGASSRHSMSMDYSPDPDLAFSPSNDSPEFEFYHASNAIRHWQSQVSEACESSHTSVQSTPDMYAPGEDDESESAGTPITPADEPNSSDELQIAKALWG